MLRQIYELASQLLTISRDVQQNKADIADVPEIFEASARI